MPKDADCVEFGDAEIRDGCDGVERRVFRKLLLNLAGLPRGGHCAEHKIQLRLTGLGNRNGALDGLNGSENGGECVEDGEKGVHAWMMGYAGSVPAPSSGKLLSVAKIEILEICEPGQPDEKSRSVDALFPSMSWVVPARANEEDHGVTSRPY